MNSDSLKGSVNVPLLKGTLATSEFFWGSGWVGTPPMPLPPGAVPGFPLYTRGPPIIGPLVTCRAEHLKTISLTSKQ